MAFSVGIALLLGRPAGYGLARSALQGKWRHHRLAHRRLHRACARLHRPAVRHLPEAAPERQLPFVILYYLTFELPFVVFMMRGYFSDLPNDLEDAARVDGCSRFTAFRRIMCPCHTRALDGHDPAASCPGASSSGALIFTGSSNLTAPVAIEEYMGRPHWTGARWRRPQCSW